MNGRISTIALICTTLLCAAEAQSQTLEVWGGLPIIDARVESSFATTYTPVLNFSTGTTGQAGQRVDFTGERPVGFEAGLGLFLSPHAGVQLLVAYDRADLVGSLGDYSLRLDYTARQPPDYVSRPYSYSRTFPGGEAMTGRLKQLTISVNGVGRWALASHVVGSLSGGLSYVRASGEGEPLDYTVFQLGGHSVLFYDAYKLTYSLDKADGIGFNLGGGIEIGLAPWLALVGDARYFATPELELPLTVTGLREDSEVYLSTQDVPTIQKTLNPAPVKVNTARTRLLVALKVRR